LTANPSDDLSLLAQVLSTDMYAAFDESATGDDAKGSVNVETGRKYCAAV